MTEILAPFVDPSLSTNERFGWQWPFHSRGTTMHSGLKGTYADYFKFAFVRNPYDRVMSWWRDRGKGKSLPTITSLTRGLDYLARYEEFEREVRFICAELGIPLKVIPHRLNAKSRQRQMTQREAELVFSTYRIDFERFGYDRESWKHFPSTSTNSQEASRSYDFRVT